MSLTLDTGCKKIQEFVLDLDRERDEICQPLLETLIGYATEIRDMRRDEISNYGNMDLPSEGRLLHFKVRTPVPKEE